MELKWHSFLIPGVFFTAIGIGMLNVLGLGPLTIGALAAGFFLNLAAVLKAREQ